MNTSQHGSIRRKMRSDFESWFENQFWAGCFPDQKKNFYAVWQAALSQSEPVSQPIAFSNSTAYLYWKEGHRPTKDTLLYTSPRGYEALYQRVAELKIKLVQENVGYIEALNQCVINADRTVRLQSECDRLKELAHRYTVIDAAINGVKS